MQLPGIWAAMPTTFLADGGHDLLGIAGNACRRRDALGLDGVLGHGLMGEGCSLALEEPRAALPRGC